MSQNFERSISRLKNIQTIEPMISALRTMSMGAWQMALNKLAKMKQFEDSYTQILLEILPLIKKEEHHRKNAAYEPEAEIADTIILIIGSERGLCGKFNVSLAEKALAWIDQMDFSSYQIWAMGAKMVQKLAKFHATISWRAPLPAGEFASYQQSYITAQKWLEQYEAFGFNNFFILFNQLVKGGSHQFTISKLLPYEIQHSNEITTKSASRWPPYIIETNLRGIYHQIIQHKIASNFYQILLESAAAEHSARYNLMEEAKDNAEEIIEELNRVIHAERRRKITQSMQELAAGAGLLDSN